ncbi:glycosyltransferase [Alteromonas sp. D210916BOD_24]|uniref:glycosyltransferase n=1 Tax=Alteromonas sp. D210916BOD_24 TaxID=3157618 RepID=UPI00399CBCAA
MRVLHITYDMRIGGTEMVIKNLIESNTDDTIAMSIFCIECPLGPWGEELKDAGVPVYKQKRQPGFDIGLIKTIRQHIKEKNIDIVHCHQYTPWVYGALATAFTNTRVVFTEHGRFYPDSSSWKRKLVNPFLSQLTSAITAISKATKEALITYEFIRPEKIDVVYNGIKPLEPVLEALIPLKAKLELPEDAWVFGTVARLDPIKNQKMLIRAFANVSDVLPNAYLLIVGDGELMSELKALVAQLNLTQKVIFTGYKSNPTNYLAIMDVFLLPSLSEGTSITLLEAMSLGKPCIVTNAGGNPEIVAHLETGLVTANDNEQELEEAMLSISQSKELYSQLAANAMPRFKANFHAKKMFSNYAKIYRETLE